jgi:apolipoprotein D and lipocalin family protein
MKTALLFAMCACASRGAQLKPLATPIDITRYMGDWHVLGYIPIDFFWGSEAHAYNAVESYTLEKNGTIRTHYRFNKGSFNGPEKTFDPKGFVHNTETNTEWRMQFLWPFKSAYLIAYLSADYSSTIVGVPDRSYVWLMARKSHISEDTYQHLLREVQNLGYNPALIQRVPQQWTHTP